jgi:hypothetical protein
MLRYALLLTAAPFATAADDPTFKYTLQKDKDSITATTKDGSTTFAIVSPGGIGSGTITRVGDAWPKAIVVRLNLSGLEKFDAKAGKLELHAFVNVSSMKSVTFTKDGKPVEGYGPKHPLWTEIKIFDADGTPRETTHIPKRGWFEIALPKDFFEGNPESVTLDWIDYFRR